MKTKTKQGDTSLLWGQNTRTQQIQLAKWPPLHGGQTKHQHSANLDLPNLSNDVYQRKTAKVKVRRADQTATYTRHALVDNKPASPMKNSSKTHLPSRHHCRTATTESPRGLPKAFSVAHAGLDARVQLVSSSEGGPMIALHVIGTGS